MQEQQELPRTSRVNDKILEYYAKFGRDRDLEKFMRLYSPATTETTKSRSSGASSSCEDIISGIRRLFEDSHQTRHASCSSMPNINLEAIEKDVIVNIPICDERDNRGGGTVGGAASGDDLAEMSTPKRPLVTSTKETQTPDSIGKSHKRLEWDSLGDVGYLKSMSTSNISVLERSLLRELFHESSATPSSTSHNQLTNVGSEGGLKRLEGGGVVKETDTRARPLASSTFVDAEKQQHQQRSSERTGAKPKVRTHSQGTSTSLLKQYEKYAQTSVSRPQLASREVQVSMSSVSGSAMGSSATPSSFEYYSSRSSCSTSLSTSNGHRKSSHCSRVPQHPFIAKINEILAGKRRMLSDKSSQSDFSNGSSSNDKNSKSNSSAHQYDACAIEELHETIKRALDEENKENSCTPASLLLLRSPQVDLGIQLLCSLIDARSLTSRRKKQLVREIVKRISHLDDDEASGSERRSTATSTQQHSSVGGGGSSRRGLSQTERHHANEVARKPSPPETSAKARAKLAAMKGQQPQGKASDVERTREKINANEERAKNDEAMQIKITAKTTTPANKQTNAMHVEKSVNTDISSSAQQATHSTTPTTATTTTPSKELTTQKAAYEAMNSADDSAGEQATMHEWLNPLTQSEIEYEQKQRRTHARSDKRHKASSSKERDVQLHWIDKEIQRLESLRHLLLKRDPSCGSAARTPHAHSAKTTASSLGEPLTETGSEGKIYDAVYSDAAEKAKAAASGFDGRKQEREMEVISESAGEEQRAKGHKGRGTPAMLYDMPATEASDLDAARTTASGRTSKKSAVAEPKKQRSKIDTPLPPAPPASAAAEAMATATTSSSGNDSESVGSFVQQRKREFLAQYKSKRRSHQEALQQRQEQQRGHRNNRPATFDGGLYGHGAMPPPPPPPPHTYPMGGSGRHFLHDYHQLPHSRPPPPPPPPLHTKHSMAAMATSLTSSQGNQQYSTSSIFCVSSEISIPMGSNDSSSTPTTTHQYDHVTAAGTAGIGIQTTNSLLRSQPIFGVQRNQSGNVTAAAAPTKRVPQGVPIGRVPASVQVKPKPIAYVIQFDEDKPKASTTHVTSSNTTTSTIDQLPVVRVQEQDPYTLQEHLERARPQFLAQSKERKAILNHLQSLRQAREREMRDIVENTSFNSLERNLQQLPPPPTKQVRVFATKEMKAMTSKRVANLPEVLLRKQRERDEKQRMGNRILREVFNRRMHRRVRNGKLSLNHSLTVI